MMVDLKCKSIAASTCYVCLTAMLLQHGCSFTLPPIDSMQVEDITIFLKLACFVFICCYFGTDLD